MGKPHASDSSHRQPAATAAPWTPEPIDVREWYVEDDKVAESHEHSIIAYALFSALTELVRLRGWDGVFVGMNTYFAWIPEHPLAKVAPDVYLLDSTPEPLLCRSWQTWQPGHPPPRFAIEVVSEDWRKDYEHDPIKYAQLGCAELVLFDPDAARGIATNRRIRVPLTVFRRDATGRLVRRYSGAGPARSEQLRCWLVPETSGRFQMLRFSEDKCGRRLIPTGDERAEHEAQARQESERRSQESERRSQESERRSQESERRSQESERRRQTLEEQVRKLKQELQGREKGRTRKR